MYKGLAAEYQELREPFSFVDYSCFTFFGAAHVVRSYYDCPARSTPHLLGWAQPFVICIIIWGSFSPDFFSSFDCFAFCRQIFWGISGGMISKILCPNLLPCTHFCTFSQNRFSALPESGLGKFVDKYPAWRCECGWEGAWRRWHSASSSWSAGQLAAQY